MDADSAGKKLVRVVIFQQPYTLSGGSDAKATEELAASVDGLMNQIAGKAVNADPARIAVLAALHLADQVRQLQQDLNRLKSRISSLHEKTASIED